jgi:outer membrane protein assembly factor BamE (lipoprotein component of BamABCDE complex)
MKKCLTIIDLTFMLVVLLSGCSIFHKSVNQQKQETQSHFLSIKDSTGKTTIDSSGGSGFVRWGAITVDSGYDKITEEIIKEIIDSNVIRRETTRTIKEKGQKRTEQSSATIRNDSASKKISQGTTVNHLQGQASSSIVVSTKKQVARTSFLPWWIWLIVAALIALGWWQRNPIIEFFKPNK